MLEKALEHSFEILLLVIIVFALLLTVAIIIIKQPAGSNVEVHAVAALRHDLLRHSDEGFLVHARFGGADPVLLRSLHIEAHLTLLGLEGGLQGGRHLGQSGRLIVFGDVTFSAQRNLQSSVADGTL